MYLGPWRHSLRCRTAGRSMHQDATERMAPSCCGTQARQPPPLPPRAAVRRASCPPCLVEASKQPRPARGHRRVTRVGDTPSCQQDTVEGILVPLVRVFLSVGGPKYLHFAHNKIAPHAQNHASITWHRCKLVYPLQSGRHGGDSRWHPKHPVVNIGTSRRRERIDPLPRLFTAIITAAAGTHAVLIPYTDVVWTGWCIEA